MPENNLRNPTPYNMPQDEALLLGREIFPDAPEPALVRAIWVYTRYPRHWETENPQEELRQQLRDWRDKVMKEDGLAQIMGVGDG